MGVDLVHLKRRPSGTLLGVPRVRPHLRKSRKVRVAKAVDAPVNPTPGQLLKFPPPVLDCSFGEIKNLAGPSLPEELPEVRGKGDRQIDPALGVPLALERGNHDMRDAGIEHAVHNVDIDRFGYPEPPGGDQPDAHPVGFGDLRNLLEDLLQFLGILEELRPLQRSGQKLLPGTPDIDGTTAVLPSPLGRFPARRQRNLLDSADMVVTGAHFRTFSYRVVRHEGCPADDADGRNAVRIPASRTSRRGFGAFHAPKRILELPQGQAPLFRKVKR